MAAPLRRRRRSGGGGGGFGPSISVGGGRKLRPLEALLWGAAGYISGDVLDQTGIAWLLYDNVPMWKNLVDKNYATGNTAAASYGGGKMLVKLAGLGLLGKAAQSAMRSGTTDKTINAELPLAFGLMFDGPGDSWPGASGGGGGGYW